MAPRGNTEAGYAWFLGTQLQRDDAVVFVAELDGHVVGYVYAGIEPQSWKELRDEAGFIHDVYVDESARRGGVATALLEAAAEWLAGRGMPRIVLWTAAPNDVCAALVRAPRLPPHDDRDDARNRSRLVPTPHSVLGTHRRDEPEDVGTEGVEFRGADAWQALQFVRRARQ